MVHCKKVDDVDSDRRVIKNLQNGPASEVGSEAGMIEGKKNEIGENREQLSTAGKMHNFQRHAGKTQAMIKGRMLIIDTLDMGKD